MEHILQTFQGTLGRKITPNNCATIPLDGTELYRLEGDTRGTRLVCLEGNLWITQANDTADYVLSAGESFTVTHTGVVLVQGLPEGKVRALP